MLTSAYQPDLSLDNTANSIGLDRLVASLRALEENKFSLEQNLVAVHCVLLSVDASLRIHFPGWAAPTRLSSAFQLPLCAPFRCVAGDVTCERKMRRCGSGSRGRSSGDQASKPGWIQEADRGKGRS